MTDTQESSPLIQLPEPTTAIIKLFRGQTY